MAPVLDHTSVPEWARTPTAQPVDPAAASTTILSFSATALAEGWSRELSDLAIAHRIVALRPGDRAEEQRIMTAELQRAVVGWRLMLAGPLTDVLRTRARALQAGLLGAEIIVGTTEVDRVPVSCAHCATTTLTTARATRLITCAGCAETLVVHDHLSPLRGGFLGVTRAPEPRLEPTGEPA
ncbi:dimethylamine monooxygenase subunit DmmA family protein [Nesterenkonia sp. CF4.4]|uniref:dimethylamine monooxygenase subunit DmmA family protein n=1 Tax=Nesterenkonia sp. CF4.4 TaxID=3373079 RepID=UPI003EE6D697